MIEDANFDDMSLQPGDDREFKNQFVEFLRKNKPVDDEPNKKAEQEKPRVKRRRRKSAPETALSKLL